MIWFKKTTWLKGPRDKTRTTLIYLSETEWQTFTTCCLKLKQVLWSFRSSITTVTQFDSLSILYYKSELTPLFYFLIPLVYQWERVCATLNPLDLSGGRVPTNKPERTTIIATKLHSLTHRTTPEPPKDASLTSTRGNSRSGRPTAKKMT